MSVEIAIIKIKEDEFVAKDIFVDKIDSSKLTIGFNLDFNWQIEQENFYLKLTIHYNYKNDEEEIGLVKFSFTTGFHVRGLKDSLNADGSNFQLPDSLMMTFLSTSVSSGRGMLAYKLAGTPLSDFYLPLVDVNDFLNQIKKKHNE